MMRDYHTFGSAMIVLLGLGVHATPAQPQGRQPVQTDVFVSGTNGYHTYRIPAIVLSTKRTLLAFCEGRKSSPADDGDIDLLLRRSFDGGQTWTKTQCVHEEGGSAPITIGNPCPVVDRSTGTIHLLFSRNNGRAFHTCSTDDGATWSRPLEITPTFKAFAFQWTRLATGPGHGIQIEADAYKGRLIVPVWLNKRKDEAYRSAVIYSDDAARTWRAGGLVGEQIKDTNECMAVETGAGRLYLTMRAKGVKMRSQAWSSDGGITWSDPQKVEGLIGPTCQASILGLPHESQDRPPVICFANPASTQRTRLTVRISIDSCKTWSTGQLLHAGPSAYSDLCVMPDGAIGCLYERGQKHPYERITLARLDRSSLIGGTAPR